jgi:two-component system NtrC family sensor kinase
VLTYAKLLKRRVQQSSLANDVKREVENELTIIADETARCGTIVKDLLLFSRQQVGEFRETDLRQILTQSFTLIEYMMEMNTIRLEKHIEADSSLLVADANQLEQAFLAITINAIEAMPGGGTLKVHVTEDAGTNSFRIVFSDTGIGIREEDMAHIFEPFYTTKRDGKGTGLGLAVTYGIIERHGGSIQVQSRPHEGTRITITLPRHAAQQVPLSTTTTTTV